MDNKHLAYVLKDKYKLNENEINRLVEDINQGKIDNISEELNTDIKLIEKGYPIAYIIGYVDFINTHIDLSFKTLIPRPETEFWVEKTLEKIPEGSRILDMFCGSGCIGVGILKNIPNTKATFVDIDPNSINQTKLNLEINEIQKSRYRLVESDLYQNIGHSEFHYIFANPPYIGENDTFENEIKFEPTNALFTEGESTKFIESFLRKSPEYLIEGGTIFMEFGVDQAKQVDELLKKFKYSKWKFHKDQYGIYRWVEIYNA